MLVEEFIKHCADGIKDPTLIVISPEEWTDILNFQAGELFPEIGYRGISEFNIPDQISNYQVSFSGPDFLNLEDVKEVWLEDHNGKKYPYEDWVFNKEIKILDLDPLTSKAKKLDPMSFKKLVVIWHGYLPTITKTTDEINLSPAKLILLKKICIKEAIRRILLDHVKLDRYRTLVGQGNEYALLSMIKNLTEEIEYGKRKLTDTHAVKAF